MGEYKGFCTCGGDLCFLREEDGFYIFKCSQSGAIIKWSE